MYTAGGSFPQVRFLYGLGLNPVGGVKCTLSVGDGISIGGSMSLDAPNKEIDTASPSENGNTQYQIVWDLDADSVPVNEWTIVRPVGFTDGLEVAGLLNPGPAHSVSTDLPTAEEDNPASTGSPVREVTTLTSGNPSASGSPVREVTTLTSGNPSASGSPVREVTTLTSGNPSVSGASVREVTTDTNIVGDLSRPADNGRPYTQSGGDVGFQVDGVEAGTRAALNLVAGVGVQLIPDPALPQGPAVEYITDESYTELGRSGVIDCVNDTPGDTYEILTVPAPYVKAIALRAIVRLVALTGFVDQPQISIRHAIGGGANVAAIQSLTFTTGGAFVADIPLGNPGTRRPRSATGQQLHVELEALSTGTSYQVEVIVYGQLTRGQ
jgi:hypothetical protein